MYSLVIGILVSRRHQFGPACVFVFDHMGGVLFMRGWSCGPMWKNLTLVANNSAKCSTNMNPCTSLPCADTTAIHGDRGNTPQSRPLHDVVWCDFFFFFAGAREDLRGRHGRHFRHHGGEGGSGQATGVSGCGVQGLPRGALFFDSDLEPDGLLLLFICCDCVCLSLMLLLLLFSCDLSWSVFCVPRHVVCCPPPRWGEQF